MDRKKPAPPPSSSSNEGSSSEEEVSDQGFVRSDRSTAKKAPMPVPPEEEDSDEEDSDEEDEEEEDADHDGGIGSARDNREAGSSSDTTQAGHGHGDSTSGSETNSASKGKPRKPSHQFVVTPREAENANGHTKKTPTSEKPPKVRPIPETSPKKTKDKTSKRDRDAEQPQEKGSSKKQKKENSSKPSKTEEVSKEKMAPSHISDKKVDVKKPSHVAVVSEDPKIAQPQQNSVRNPENASARKAGEKRKYDRKATPKDAEPDPLKGSSSPSKPKVFTPKEEFILTTEILSDVKDGVEVPVKKGDVYWDNLFDRVKGRMESSISKERICDKAKRMKIRYTAMAAKFKDSAECKFRNSSDKELFGLWAQIWGSGDAMDVYHEREDSDSKDKQFKVSSPVKGGKASRNKGVAAIKDVKIVHEESEGLKSKQTKKKETGDGTDDDDDADISESEESDGEGDLDNKLTALIDMDRKDALADHTLVPKGNAVQVHGDKVPSRSIIDAQKLFREEVRATLSELQESSKQAWKEWQGKALVAWENVVRANADQSRLLSGAGLDGLSNPLRGLDSQMVEGDQALQKEWQEVRLRELDVYSQKLELMQKECQLKQDQLRLQLRGNK